MKEIHVKGIICAILLVATAVALPLPATGQAERSSPEKPLAPGEIRLTFLGSAGWEITDGRSVVLVDPYLTNSRAARTRAAADSMRRNPSDTRPVFGPDDPRWPDTAAIDTQIRRADYILMTHGHSDHSLDAPYITRKMGAVIIGHETAANKADRPGADRLRHEIEFLWAWATGRAAGIGAAS